MSLPPAHDPLAYAPANSTNAPAASSPADASPERRPTMAAGGQYAIVLAALVIIGAGLRTVSSVFAPFFFAYTLVLCVLPFHRFLVRHRVPVWISITGCLITLYVTLVAVVGSMVISIAQLPSLFTSYQEQFNQLYVKLVNWLQTQNVSKEQIEAVVKKIDVNTAIDLAMQAFSQITSISSTVLLILLALFFLVMDTATNGKGASLLTQFQPNLARSFARFEYSVRQYWIVSTIFGLIVAVVDVIGLIWLGIPAPITWGVLAFVTNYIPNIGFVMGLVPPAIIGLLHGGPMTMVWVIVLYCVANFVIQSLIQPKFTADAVGLNTSTTFISLVVWSIIVGPLGSILAIPLTLFFKAIFVDSDPRAAWINAILTSGSDADKAARKADKIRKRDEKLKASFERAAARGKRRRKGTPTPRPTAQPPAAQPHPQFPPRTAPGGAPTVQELPHPPRPRQSDSSALPPHNAQGNWPPNWPPAST